MNDVIAEMTLPDKNGFKIKLFALVEDLPIEGQFALDTEEETKKMEQKTIKQIESGEILYFCAKVSASKAGIELGHDILGGCMYKDLKEFSKDGYCSDMIDTAIEEAKKSIEAINK